jgi:hypothetical protein
MKTTNFTLKFGKYKGQNFLDTPKDYQCWLLKQDWFKAPINDELTNAQRQFSNAAKKLGNWNGYSARGAAIYDNMFEAEKGIDNAIFNTSDMCSPFYNGDY